MKRVILIWICLATCLGVWSAPKMKRVVMIALDGISVQGFQEAKTPHLDALLEKGALSLTTRAIMPSVTLPNWTSHLTGSGPEQHGVATNEWTLEKHPLPAVDTDKEGYYPSVFKVLKEAIPSCKTAFYYNWLELFYPHNKSYFDEVSYMKDDEYISNYRKAFDFIMDNKIPCGDKFPKD